MTRSTEGLSVITVPLEVKLSKWRIELKIISQMMVFKDTGDNY